MALYFAYGSNLNRQQMKLRCPSAVPLSKGILSDHQFEFRKYANVFPLENALTPGAVYDMNEADLTALDQYEEAPNVYQRVELPVSFSHNGKAVVQPAWVYRMVKSALSLPPYPTYYRICVEGAREWGLKTAYMEEALNLAQSAAPSTHRWMDQDNEIFYAERPQDALEYLQENKPQIWEHFVHAQIRQIAQGDEVLHAGEDALLQRLVERGVLQQVKS